MTNLLRQLARRAQALTRRATIDRDVDAEMRLHIELEAADLARRHGLSPYEAHRRAAVAFGGVGRHAEEHRDARGVRWLDDFGQDVRYAARSLRRSPGFTVTAVLVLALGIGASTAVFSAVDQILVSRLPYPNDDRIVRIYQQNSPTNRFGLGTVEHDAIVAQHRSFTAVGAARWRAATVAVGPNVHGTSVALATPGFFSVLGVRAARGRVIGSGDEAPGRLVATVTHT